MNFLDYHKINSAYQDSLRRTKADPLPVKQQDYYDFNTDFKQEVTASGTIEIHGVVQNKTIPGVLIKNGSQITLTSKFKVALKDFNIQIPKVVGNSIAEEIEITAKFVYEPKLK